MLIKRYEACNVTRRAEKQLMQKLGLKTRKALRKYQKKQRRLKRETEEGVGGLVDKMILEGKTRKYHAKK